MARRLTGYEKAGRLIRFLGWLSLVAAVCLGLGATLIHFGGEAGDMTALAGGLVSAGFGAVLGAFYLILGSAIKAHKEWGRIVGIILGILALFGFPIGTIIGVYLLYHLFKYWDDKPVDVEHDGAANPTSPPASADR